MSTSTVANQAPAMLTVRQKLALTASVAVVIFVLLSVGEFLLGRPPAVPQLTFIGSGDALSILAEGIGGGRVLIGGGPNGADLPAALGRHFVPWRRHLDLLVIVDHRDLAGATELVRRGQVRAVLLVGLGEERAAAAGLAVLRDECAARGVPVRISAEPERVTIGRGAALTLDIVPASTNDEGAQLRLRAGTLSAAIVTGSAVPAPAQAVILPRAAVEPYRAAFGLAPSILVAPALPAASVSAAVSADSRLLLVVSGQRATLSMTDHGVALRGATLTALDTAAVTR